jgi:phage protein D
VTVSGSGFTGATAVNFGPGNPGTGVLVVPDGTQLIVTSPAGGGTVDVTVTTPLGTSPVVPADHFTYTKPPKEGKDKEKDQKDVKDKDKDKDKDKEKERLKDNLKDKEKDKDIRDVRPVQPFATPGLGQQAAGRAFIGPDERPAVGSNVLNDDEQDLS